MAGLDGGLLQFSLPHSSLYGKSIQEKTMAVASDSAPSYMCWRRASLFRLYAINLYNSHHI
jgi:hypothetical protein